MEGRLKTIELGKYFRTSLAPIPGLGSSPGGGKVYPLQYSGLEDSMDCIVYGVSRSQTLSQRLSDFHW